MNEQYVIYDLETIKTCFTGVFKDFETKERKRFVIHESRNDLKKLYKFCKSLINNHYWWVGFNNLGFDGRIIEFILKNGKRLSLLRNEEIIKEIYDLSQRIIHLREEERFANLIPEWKLSTKQIDLFVQKHYNSRNKSTSLKWLEFTMRRPNIKSMPVNHDADVSEEEIEMILDYNDEDVDATYQAFEINKFETDLRLKLSDKYRLSLMNASEPRLARDIFGKFLSDAMGIPYRDLKERRTYRYTLEVAPLLFDYVKFKDPILQGVKQWFESISFNPYTYREESETAYQKSFKFGNIQADVGLGGIHGCVQPGVYNATKDHVIQDVDATSYYPMLGIRNRLYPEHLSETFCDIYEDLFNLRAEIPKEDPINYAYKIILNAAYGLSQQPDNYFHDPKYTFAVTVNGQLLLLMLAELLKVRIPDIVFYQFNTDGITIGYDPKYTDEVKNCLKRWENLTKIGLEDKFYTKMVIRDVNNYMAVDIKGKVKRKGVFGYSMKPEDKEMDYHKNPSALVVPKALEAYFINDVPYEDYIRVCKDMYDFCCGVKVTSDFDLYLLSYNKEKYRIDKEVMNEKVVRYYVSTENTSLKKKYKPGSKNGMKATAKGKSTNFTELHAGCNTTYFNTFVEKPMKKYNLNYDYYISEAEKIIRTIQPARTQLKLEL